MDFVVAGFVGVLAGLCSSYFLWSEAVFRVKRENRRMKETIAKLSKIRDEPIRDRIIVAAVTGMSGTECHRDIEYLAFRSVDIADSVMAEMKKRK